jgi:hypothetical protein
LNEKVDCADDMIAPEWAPIGKPVFVRDVDDPEIRDATGEFNTLGTSDSGGWKFNMPLCDDVNIKEGETCLKIRWVHQ